jgi:hypothetical protein
MVSRPPTPRQPDDAPAPLSPEEIREELRILEANISGAEKTAAEFRRLIGERSAGADREELGQLITQAQEQEAVLRILAARRERLQKRLAGAG